jgi:hypothetical protein
MPPPAPHPRFVWNSGFKLTDTTPLDIASNAFVKALSSDEVSLEELRFAYRTTSLAFEREGTRRGLSFGSSAPTRIYIEALTMTWNEMKVTAYRESRFREFYRETIGREPDWAEVRDLFKDLKAKAASSDETLRRSLVFLKHTEIKENERRSEKAKETGEDATTTAFRIAIEDTNLVCCKVRASIGN